MKTEEVEGATGEEGEVEGATGEEGEVEGATGEEGEVEGGQVKKEEVEGGAGEEGEVEEGTGEEGEGGLTWSDQCLEELKQLALVNLDLRLCLQCCGRSSSSTTFTKRTSNDC